MFYKKFEQQLSKSLQSNKILALLNISRESLNDVVDLLVNCSVFIITGTLMVNEDFTVGTTLAFLSYISYVLLP